MAGSNLLPSAREEVIDPKSNKFTRGWLLFFEQIATRLLPLLSGNATEFLNGVGAFVSINAGPKDAEYLVATANATLTAERVTTDTTSITWDNTTAAQAKAKRAALTGDVTAAADNNATTIANDAVTNAKLANMAQATFKLRAAAAGTGDPIDGTPNQASTILDGATDPFLRTSAASAGSGTVTHTAGALTASAVMVGNGAADSKVLASLGTTTTLLHGNAAGLPSFSAVDLANDVTGVLPTTKLGAGAVVQILNTQTGVKATGTTVIPIDDTIPQNTEGDQYMSLAITPTSATNKLKIDVVAFLTPSVGGWMIGALFQDTTAGALAAFANYNATNLAADAVLFTHYMTTGTTSATTFKLRGGMGTAGTTTFNGNNTIRLLGGVMASSITITEIAV